MIDASATRHSNRIEMNTATTSRKMTSARIAFSVISRPHVELTELTLISSALTSADSANAERSCSRTSGGLIGDLDLDQITAVGAALLDLRLARVDPVVAQDGFGVLDGERRRGDVPDDPAFEVDAEVEPTRDERHDA